MKNKTAYSKILPVLFGFFIMGFVDVVGVSISFVKKDFTYLTEFRANLIGMMVFLWFFVLSVPTGVIMNKIGRKKTVLISMGITLIGMLVPLLAYNFAIVLIAFALLGIGNTILQVSLNPLLTNVISGEKLTSNLTLGQFIKAISSFLGPIIASFAATSFGNWKLIFPVYATIILISSLWLILTQIKEESVKEKTSSFSGCFSLLKDRAILMFFIGILVVVGIDVGLNTTVPKLLADRFGDLFSTGKVMLFGIELQPAHGSSLYFASRTIGAFVGAILLIGISARRFFIVSMLTAIPVLVAILFIHNLWTIMVLVFILGFACANVFSIIFSMAMKRNPERANDISGLMVMGIGGAAIIVPIMGYISDNFGQTGAMAALLPCLLYLLFCAFGVKRNI